MGSEALAPARPNAGAPIPGETEALARWPELRPFVARVEARYGDRLRAVLLYGSRARGEAREDSDYDVALLLEGPFDMYQEVGELAEMTHDDFMDGLYIQGRPIRTERVASPDRQDFFARNVALDGIALFGEKP